MTNKTLSYVIACLTSAGIGVAVTAKYLTDKMVERSDQYHADMKAMTKGIKAINEGYLARLEAEAIVLEHIIETQDHDFLRMHLESLKQEIKESKEGK